MERTIYNCYYNTFMHCLHQIDRYKNSREARQKRLTMTNNLYFAVAKAYESGEMSGDKARFYNMKINDYMGRGN